ncbi:hypothetical protein F383_33564 [Gossypium arboreum]|uniref:Uncharacterized protein n=1 Tax=Gossypium arboreum TaxID=29729 RepID=A0A0B0PT73_GOSAR|nr:hypothetical protein F383_33564 [Gossypium arboreum]
MPVCLSRGKIGHTY